MRNSACCRMGVQWSPILFLERSTFLLNHLQAKSYTPVLDDQELLNATEWWAVGAEDLRELDLQEQGWGPLL